MNFFLVTLQQRPSFQRFSFEQYKLFCKLSLPLEKIKQINISYHLSIYSKLESQWIGAINSNFQIYMTMYNEYAINVLSKCIEIYIISIEVFRINTKNI